MAARTLPVCAFPGCQKRCWLEQSGKVHPFCGITHAGEAKKKGMSGVGAGHQNRTCQLAGCSEPALFDDRRNCWHDFCSRSHASAAIASGQQWVRGGGGTGASTCRFPGCRAGVYRNQATGKESNFCSERHRDSSTGVPSRNPYILLVFRVGTTSASGFTLSALAPAHRDYVSIRNQFDLKWIKHGAPMVLHILKLEVPAAGSRSFFNYSQTSSNVKRRFHGTGCSARCNFFADLKGSPCEGMDCRVCSICTCGFKINGNVGTTARRTSISLRYGEGLYFSSVSGKANDYAAFSEKNISGRRLRCMFVANVCAGKAYSTMQGSLPQNMCPPANYDSVVGEAGQALNHDELVVYKEEAALPTHLIVYSLP